MACSLTEKDKLKVNSESFMKNILKEVWGDFSRPQKIFFYMMFILALGLLVLGLAACSFLRDYPDDNIFEEIVEKVIDEETGYDIDLSPFSRE